MNYQVQVNGMHCQGCKNLITMSLQELGFMNVTLDLASGTGKFSSDKKIMDVEELLRDMFSQFESYTYTNLIQTKNV